MIPTIQSAALQAAAVTGQLAGAAVDYLLDWLAPVDKSRVWPEGEQDLIEIRMEGGGGNGAGATWAPVEPPFTDDERCGLRQLLDERFGLALAETADQLAAVAPMWVGGADGFQDVGCQHPFGYDHPCDRCGHPGGNVSSPAVSAGVGDEVPPGAVAPKPAPGGQLKVTTGQLICAAIGLREYAGSDACEAPVYWQHLANELDPRKETK